MGWIMRAKRKMVEADGGEVTRERFRINVEQNHNTAGMGTTKFLKYQWQVVDTLTGRPVKTDFAYTAGSAYMIGESWLNKLLNA